MTWGTRKMMLYRCHCCLVAKSCLTLCDPMDCSPPGSSVHGILQARVREWGAMPSSRGPSPPRDWTHGPCIGEQVLHHWATRKRHHTGGTVVKNLLVDARDAGDLGSVPGSRRSPGGGDGNPNQSSILAWKIPWTEKPGGLSPQSCRESGVTERLRQRAK